VKDNNRRGYDMDRAHVRIWLESNLNYYGGGERIAIVICNYLYFKGFDAAIIENSRFSLKARVTDSFISENCHCQVLKKEFVNPGLLSKLQQDLPEVRDLIKESGVSLMFLRRIPPNQYLREIKNKKVSVILCLHGIALEGFRFTSPIIIAHQILMRFQLRRLAHYVRGNIFVQVFTKNVRHYLVNHGASSDNVMVIYNSIGPAHFSVGRNDSEFRAIFIGRIENIQKGISTLLKVANLLESLNNNIRLVIVGTGRDDKMLVKFPNNSYVLGNITDESKYGQLSSSNLMIITSNLEPFGLVALEGLFSGLPIVSTPVSGTVEIISNENDFGTISTFSPSDLAFCINKYYENWLSNKRKYYDQKIRIREKSLKLFNREPMSESYESAVRLAFRVSGR